MRQHLGHQRLRGRGIHSEVFGQAGRRFHQRRLRFAVAHQVHESTDRVGFTAVIGNMYLGQRFSGRGFFAQPHGEHRLVPCIARLPLDRMGQGQCRFGGRRQRGRHVDHQQRIAVGIFQQGLDCRRIACLIGITQDVHRVVL